MLIPLKNPVVAIHHALSYSAEKFSLGWITGPYNEPATLPTGEPNPHGDPYFGAPTEFRALGAAVRQLVDQPYVHDFSDVAERGLLDDEEIRVVEEKLPMKLLIVHDRVALVPLGPYGHPYLLIRSPSLVQVFARFFALMWARGIPWLPSGTTAKRKRRKPVRGRSRRSSARLVDAVDGLARRPWHGYPIEVGGVGT